MLENRGVTLYNCCNLGVSMMASADGKITDEQVADEQVADAKPKDEKPTDGYHILYMAQNHQAWICPERVGRHQPNDPQAVPTANHFLTRAAANDYIRRRWQSRLRRRVEECTWSSTKTDKKTGERVRVLGVCLRAHLPEWLEKQEPAEVAAWQEARRALTTAKGARRRERTAQRKEAFEVAVAAEVARRLAELGIA